MGNNHFVACHHLLPSLSTSIPPSIRSWRSRPGLTVWPWPLRHSVPPTWWRAPSSRSPCSATAPPTCTSTAPRPTCPHPPRWTSTTAPFPSTRCAQTTASRARMAPAAGTVNWRSWWGTTPCRPSRPVTRCYPRCRRRARTASAITTAPAPAWRRKSRAVSDDDCIKKKRKVYYIYIYILFPNTWNTFVTLHQLILTKFFWKVVIRFEEKRKLAFNDCHPAAAWFH